MGHPRGGLRLFFLVQREFFSSFPLFIILVFCLFATVCLSPSFHISFMINIMSWNCRGARARYFPRLIRELKANYNIHILFIVEPRVSRKKVDNIIKNLGFNSNHRVEAEGYSGGIWLLWDDRHVKINVISTSNQCVHTMSSYNVGKEECESNG